LGGILFDEGEDTDFSDMIERSHLIRRNNEATNLFGFIVFNDFRIIW